MEKFLNTFSFVGGLMIIFMGLTVVLSEAIDHSVPLFIRPFMVILLFSAGISVIVLVSKRASQSN